MWPHFKAVQSSQIGGFENVQKRKGHQSGDAFYPKILPRGASSLPARRTSSNCPIGKVHNGDHGKFESQASSSFRGENFTQRKDVSNSKDTPENEDVLPIKENRTLQTLGCYRQPLQENSPYPRDLAFKKYFLEQRCTGSNDSLVFKMKRKCSPSLFSLANSDLQPSRKKCAAATDSPWRKPRSLSGSYDPAKPMNFWSNSASKFFLFQGETATFPISRKSLEENHNFGSFSTTSVQSYPSPDDIVRISKKNLPSPSLSPESLELPKETMSSPESVCERMVLYRGLMDRDNDVQSSAQSHPSPTIIDSSSEEAQIHVPMSPLHENNWYYRTDEFSQLQPLQTDPDEEYGIRS